MNRSINSRKQIFNDFCQLIECQAVLMFVSFANCQRIWISLSLLRRKLNYNSNMCFKSRTRLYWVDFIAVDREFIIIFACTFMIEMISYSDHKSITSTRFRCLQARKCSKEKLSCLKHSLFCVITESSQIQNFLRPNWNIFDWETFTQQQSSAKIFRFAWHQNLSIHTVRIQYSKQAHIHALDAILKIKTSKILKTLAPIWS